MATLINLSLLLAGFLATGSCMVCNTCTSFSEHCEGSPQTCGPLENTCLNMVGRNNLDVGLANSDTILTLKKCISSADCYASSFDITFNTGLHIEGISSCCQDDLCNQQDLNLPARNLTTNGFQCPVCSAVGSDDCVATETLKCTGLANYCLTLSGTMSAGASYKFGARGCSTLSACSLPLDKNLYSGSASYNLNKVLCTLAQKVNSA